MRSLRRTKGRSGLSRCPTPSSDASTVSLSLTADAQARRVGARERVIFAVQSEYTYDTEGSMNVRIIQNAVPKVVSVFSQDP